MASVLTPSTAYASSIVEALCKFVPYSAHTKILFIFSLPIDTRSIFTDRGHELVFDLVTVTSSDIYNSFVKCTRAKDINVLASAFAASQIQCVRLITRAFPGL